MKSHIKFSKASKSTLRKIEQIVEGTGRYAPSRLAAERAKREQRDEMSHNFAKLTGEIKPRRDYE